MNIFEEVSFMNIWIEWIDRGVGDNWLIVWFFLDLFLCFVFRGG